MQETFNSTRVLVTRFLTLPGLASPQAAMEQSFVGSRHGIVFYRHFIPRVVCRYLYHHDFTVVGPITTLPPVVPPPRVFFFEEIHVRAGF